jgi:acetyl-CoA carboxylase biotin carboxyl carrier protein
MPVYLLRSEVPGTVWKVAVEIGASVTEGTPVIIIESMKMEIPIIAEKSGTVQKVLVGEGDVVDENQVVAVIETSS